MSEEEKLFLGNRIISIYKILGSLQKEYMALKEKLEPELNAKGLKCDEGRITFNSGSMLRRIKEDVLRFILKSETGLDDQQILSILSRSKYGRFRKDFLTVNLKK